MPAGIKLSASQLRALLERVLMREGKQGAQATAKGGAEGWRDTMLASGAQGFHKGISPPLPQGGSSAGLQSLVDAGVEPVDKLMSQLYVNRAAQNLPPKPVTLPYEEAKSAYLKAEPGQYLRNFGRVPEALRLRPSSEAVLPDDPMQGLVLERLRNKPVLTPAEQFRLALVMREGQGLPQDPGAVQSLLRNAPQLTSPPTTRALPMPEGMAMPTAQDIAQQVTPEVMPRSQALDIGNQLAELWRKAGGGRGSFGKLWSGYFNSAKAGSGGAAISQRYKSPYEYYLGSGAQWKKSPGQFKSKRPTEAARLEESWKKYMDGE